LATYWKNFNSGRFMQSYHKRMTSIVTENNKPISPIAGDVYVNDHRAKHVSVENQLHPHNYGTWSYAGSSFALEDALKLNGFNERMDGCKSLEDCDFGTRLQLLGRNFTLDYNGFLYILDHQSYGSGMDIGWDVDIKKSETPKKIDNLIAIENYGMCKCATDLLDLRANCNPLTQKHFDIIQRETIKYRNFDPLAEENKEKLEIWLKTPMFDLDRDRKKVRASKDWKWANE